MISLEIFIKKCESELLLKRDLSDKTILLVENLSDRNKILCKPILDFIYRMKKPIDIDVETTEFEFSPEERVLVCRLIPLTMSLDTDSPAWSSYMLTQAIQAAVSINGLKLPEIGIAILEIFCEFKPPLNRFVYNFCIDLSKEFWIYYRERLNEFDILISWEKSCCLSTASVAFLKFCLCRSKNPRFILKTTKALIGNQFFKDFIEMNKYLFENIEYKETFLEYLAKTELSITNKSLILSAIEEK